MIFLLTKPLFLLECPKHEDSISEICINLESENLDTIDNSIPFIFGSIFTFDLNGAVFTFSSTENFTLRQVYNCIILAWKMPLFEYQINDVMDIQDNYEGVLTINDIYPPTVLNGLGWDDGKYVPLEMQD